MLLHEQQFPLVNPLCFSNAGELNDPAFQRWVLWCCAARDVRQAAVVIGRYAPNTLLNGAGPYSVLVNNTIVEEQSPPTQFDIVQLVRHFDWGRARADDIEQPSLLACHNGSRTWGHWMLDSLPKIVLAEQAYPQRFTFVIPAPASSPEACDHFDAAVFESLAAYGIAPDRLLHVRPDRYYRFQNLYDIVGIVSDGLHPGALDLMRKKVRAPRAAHQPITAIMRGDIGSRAIINQAAIDDMLRRRGAARLEPGQASFAAQVAAFRESAIIVGDLGSNLAASIYMQPEAGIVTLAPGGWYDGYFINIFQRLRLYHADLRGVALGPPGAARGAAPHCVNPADLATALDTLTETPRQLLAAPRVAGRILARAPGEVLWRLTFGAAGNAAPCQRGQWAAPEACHTWSLGRACAIAAPDFIAPETDMWLEIKGIGFTARPYLVSRQLQVSVQGVQLGDYDIGDLTHMHVPVPEGVLRARPGLHIAFGHPQCPSPHAMGVSDDTRSLGFRFEFLALRRA